jgi:hypothetical protein
MIDHLNPKYIEKTSLGHVIGHGPLIIMVENLKTIISFY